MNKILTINIDSTIPNLALEKIKKYHQDKNHIITTDIKAAKEVDKIYVSCVFTKNKHKCEEWEGKAFIGGSGYNLTTNLPEEIDKVKPRINLGFTTRGCIRNCYFCIVPKKEGYIRVESDIYDIWDGKSKELILLDNNILALPEHFKLICSQIKKEKIKVDFNQGLDYRLLTEDNISDLFSIKHLKEMRFAIDNVNQIDSAETAINLLIKSGLKNYKTRWYVYISPTDTFETVYMRLLLLKKYKQLAYVMRDESIKNIREFVALAAWANSLGAFKYDLKDLIEKSSRFVRYKKLNLPL